jgi:hypothetical protein
MRWIAFFVGALAGYFVVDVVFRLGKRTGAGGSLSDKQVST